MIGGVHVTTGNQLDVVYDLDPKGRRVLMGLAWQGSLIPLPNPDGLLRVLGMVVAECEGARG